MRDMINITVYEGGSEEELREVIGTSLSSLRAKLQIPSSHTAEVNGTSKSGGYCFDENKSYEVEFFPQNKSKG